MPVLASAILVFILIPGVDRVEAKFTWPNCADFKESDFRYVKVVTRTVDPTLDEPLKVAFDDMPDGKTDIYFVERHGKVKRYDAARNAVVVLGELDVYSDRADRAAQTGDTEHGLNGIALDPDFKHNHYIYLFYPPWGEKIFRMSRFTVNADKMDMGSEKILLTMPESRSHVSGTLILLPGGAMTFDAYGDLWITVGADSKLNPSISETDWAFSAEASSANLADLRGSVLRIHPDASAKGYSIPKGNLGEYWSQRFTQGGKAALAAEYANPAKVLPEIYVKGTRNPYSVNVDPVRRWLVWGDYGPNGMGAIKVEEQNLAVAPIYAGYPYFMGKNLNLMDKVPGMEAKDPAAPLNKSTWNKGPQQLPPATPSIYSYSGEAGGFIYGKHPTAGPIYRYDGANPSTVKLPPHFEKAWFMAEKGVGLRAFQLSESGDTITDSVSFLTAANIQRPLDLKQGPDGALYLVDYSDAWHASNASTHIGRVEYTGTCRPAEPKLELPSAARMEAVRQGPRSLLRAGRLDISGHGDYALSIRDCRGREVASLRGQGDRVFSLSDLPGGPGLYVATLAWKGGSRTLALPRL